MKFLLVASLLVFALISSAAAQCAQPSITSASGEYAPSGQICSGQVIFEDNFDTLDLALWRHENTLSGGGNWEFQWYVNDRTNSYVQNGIYHIKPTLTSDIYGEDFILWGGITIPPGDCTDNRDYGCSRQGNGGDGIINPIRSGKVTTRAGFGFRYGDVEVRAKMPAGDWIWPAIWMMPRFDFYGGWPRSGEIDISEIRGNLNLHDENGVHVGVQQHGSTMHWGPEWNVNGFLNTHWTRNSNPGFDAGFHTYRVRWTDQYLEFFLDGGSIGRVDAGAGFWAKGGFGPPHTNPWEGRPAIAPFDQEFYIILNNAVGGIAYFLDSFVNTPHPKPWTNDSPSAARNFWDARGNWLPTWNTASDQSHLQIDYVRVTAI